MPMITPPPIPPQTAPPIDELIQQSQWNLQQQEQHLHSLRQVLQPFLTVVSLTVYLMFYVSFSVHALRCPQWADLIS